MMKRSQTKNQGKFAKLTAVAASTYKIVPDTEWPPGKPTGTGGTPPPVITFEFPMNRLQQTDIAQGGGNLALEITYDQNAKFKALLLRILGPGRQSLYQSTPFPSKSAAAQQHVLSLAGVSQAAAKYFKKRNVIQINLTLDNTWPKSLALLRK